VGEEEAFGVLGIADAVVEEVPVEPVDAGVPRVAGRATLPALEAQARVVEMAFAAPLGRLRDTWAEGDERGAQGWLVEGERFQRVGEIAGDPGALARHSDGAWALTGERHTAADAEQGGEVGG
jgi:hypothetical protein